MLSGVRLVLDVNVEAGNQSQAHTTLPGLIALLERMPADKRPRCVRSDCGLGQDASLRALEDRQIPYLFKLKLTKNVKRYPEQIWQGDAASSHCAVRSLATCSFPPKRNNWRWPLWNPIVLPSVMNMRCW